MSPQHVPATVHELQRVPLLSGLDGDGLRKLAGRMVRQEVPPGTVVIREGELGERFYVLLSGLLAVANEALGPRNVLRPGEYFGEVGASMDIPRTATVTAMAPSVVASCDRATFDELVLPLFSEGRFAP